MNKATRWVGLTGAGAFAMVAIAGCNRGGKNDNTAPSPSASNVAHQPAPRSTSTAHIPPLAKPGTNHTAPPEPARPRATHTPMPKLTDASGKVKPAAQLKPIIVNALRESPTMKGTNVTVIAGDKQIILQGTVKNPAQKLVAGNITRQFSPTYTLKNDLKVG